MTTFTCRIDAPGAGPAVAVKDNIDLAGTRTTAGSRAVAASARPAAHDAACLSGVRAAGARIVGKTNMDELAMSALGINPWYGTPRNPLDASRIPGGSSSGSAVAVATGAADIAIGTDTSGSVRIPAACCGVCGLTTTHGRISTEGVWPLAPSLDTVGPLARDAAGVELGMALLEPGFRRADRPASRVGRIRTSGDPAIESAVDAALHRAGLDVTPIDLDLGDGTAADTTIFFCEAWELHHELVASAPEPVSDLVHRIMQRAGRYLTLAEQAAQQRARWRERLTSLFADVEVLALPTMPILPPTVAAARADRRYGIEVLRFTGAFNAAGTPCTAQPIRAGDGNLPASLQLVAPWHGEELLVRTSAEIEAAL